MNRRSQHLRLEIPELIPTPYQVTLVGRTNVGKSSLFNRLTETKIALVGSELHLTRDRQEGQVQWEGLTFSLVDTGGYDVTKHDKFGAEIKDQVERSIKTSQLILFVVEYGEALLPADREIARFLRSTGVPVMVVVNKADGGKKKFVTDDLGLLGFDKIYFVSARSGNGTGDLLDGVTNFLKTLPKSKLKTVKSETPKALTLAFIGQPNVGKSSLINALLGDERVIVSPIAHTTRGSQFIRFSAYGHDYQLVDTAGLRKRASRERAARGKNKSQAERDSAFQTQAVIEQADVVILVMDSTKPLSGQDSRLAKLITDAGKCLVFAANKWDLLPNRQPTTPAEINAKIYAQYPYLHWAPIVLTSATTKKNLPELLNAARAAAEERSKVLPDTGLDRFLQQLIKKHLPSRGSGEGHPRLIKLTQVRNNPPTFEVLIEYLNLHPAYLRFMEKELRLKFGFVGTPIRVQMRPLKN